MVYAFLLMFGRLRRRWPFYVAVAVFSLLFDAWYLPFLLGIVAADFTAGHSPLCMGSGIAFVLAGIAISLFPQVLLPTFLDINVLTALGAFLVLIGMHSRLRDLEIHKSKFLGWCSQESYTLIVVQNLVQFSLNTALFLHFNQLGMNASLNIALQLLVNALITVLVTYIYSITITPLTNRICRFVDSGLG